ncbi:MAG: lactonase family protein [Terrimicrobiaceae bacterium]|nr:lactonase family protein [Terrimicrobiaceae bacterium]
MVRTILMMAAMMTSGSAAPLTFYLGTYSRPGKDSGVMAGTMDSETGDFGKTWVAGEAKNPSFVAVSRDGRNVYAAAESGDGSVVAFRIVEPGKLERLNEQPSGGGGACHVWEAAGHVFVANYGGGSKAMLPRRPDGSLDPAAELIVFEGSGPDPKRQKKPYGHGVMTSPDGRFVYACDLGTDSVWVYELDAANSKLEPREPGKVPPGSGPRHLVISPDGRRLYVNNEMGMSVSTFERDLKTGTLTLRQTLPTLPDGTKKEGSSTAEILMTPDGRFVFVTNRGHDSVTGYRVREDGDLEWIENVPAGVKVPRGAGLDPSGRWLVVAGQDDGMLVSFQIGGDGRLKPVGSAQTNAVPVSVAFGPL